MTFDSPSAARYIGEISTHLNNPSDFGVNKVIVKKCSSCLGAFLRGVFLASGRLSDPEKQFSLEFSLAERVELFKSILLELSMNPLVSHKKSGDVLYFRKGDEIENFYGHAGLNGKQNAASG